MAQVDLCLKADGVNAWVEKLREKGVSVWGFATTCSAHQGAMRFALNEVCSRGGRHTPHTSALDCHTVHLSLRGCTADIFNAQTTVRAAQVVKEGAGLCTPLEEFYAEWSKKLAGGLQLTMCEDGLAIPPWEARVDMG